MDIDFKELAEVFPRLLDTGTSIELISPPGRGKSDFVKDQIKINSDRTGQPWGFSTLFLATMTPSDLLGYMVPGIDSKGRKVSEFTMPPWMVTVDGGNVNDYPRGILFLDEFGQGEADVKRASAELLLNGQLGPWKLPPGWSVVAASNRANDRSGVTKSFDFVINRRLEIHIKDDFEAWENWALAHGVDPLILAFAHNNIAIVFADGVPEKQGPWCTPRSLVMAADLLNAFREKNEDGTLGPFPTSDIAKKICAGMIGDGATAQMFATIMLAANMPKFEDILSNPETVFIPDAPDARMLVTYQLAERAKDAAVGPITKYIRRFPPEFIALWARAAVKRNPSITSTKDMLDLYMSNASLFSAVINNTAR